MIPASWMPAAKMQRVICHWTAGRHKATDLDRKHYHFIIEGDGNLVRGVPSVKLNETPAKVGYAAHTLNCNSGSIGVSMACMYNAKESPFNPGPAPMTAVQWNAMVKAVAELCRFYQIPVTPKTVLSHAEVQANLGIKQRGKWDFTRLAFDSSVIGAKACGDKMRREVMAAMGQVPKPAIDPAATHHIVQPGEGWFGIAKMYGIPLSQLLALNDDMETDVLHPGRRLLIRRLPSPAQPVSPPKAPEPAPKVETAPVAVPVAKPVSWWRWIFS
jgi:hypothetical protein